jgi:hypothetical protein
MGEFKSQTRIAVTLPHPANTAAKPARPFACRPHSGAPAAATNADAAGVNAAGVTLVRFAPNLPSDGAASA